MVFDINREFWKRKRKDDTTQANHDLIVINMCTSLLGVYVFFVISAVVTPVKVLCGISSGLLQYFLLVFFSWTSVEAVFLFMTLVKVFSNTARFALKAGLVAWSEFYACVCDLHGYYMHNAKCMVKYSCIRIPHVFHGSQLQV